MIVLIPGWAGFRSSLLPLALALNHRLDREVVRADVGFGFGCIRSSAHRVAELVERMARQRRGERIDLVAHSMGGLVAAYLLKRIDRGRSIRSVITLGTPHRGSPAVLFARGLARGPLSGLGASLQQMAPDSEFLEELARCEVPPDSRLISIVGKEDSLVPALYAELPDGPRQFSCRLAGVGHVGLLLAPSVIGAIETWLGPPPLAYPPGGSGILTRRLSTHS